MKSVNGIPQWEALARGLGLAAYLISMFALKSLLPDLLDRSNLLAVSLLMAIGICFLIDYFVRRRFGVATEFSIQGNPLAGRGAQFLMILIVAGYFVERRLVTSSTFDSIIYCTVVFFWAAALVTIIKYFRRQK